MVIINFTPLSAIIGGVFIGIAASLMFALLGRIAGISGIIANSLNTQFAANLWRYLFIIGMIGGAAIGCGIDQGPHAITITSNTWLLIIAGFLVGFGALLGGGCTSGHGVCGISRLSKRSLLATAIFMITAMLIVFVRKVFL